MSDLPLNELLLNMDSMCKYKLIQLNQRKLLEDVGNNQRLKLTDIDERNYISIQTSFQNMKHFISQTLECFQYTHNDINKEWLNNLILHYIDDFNVNDNYNHILDALIQSTHSKCISKLLSIFAQKNMNIITFMAQYRLIIYHCLTNNKIELRAYSDLLMVINYLIHFEDNIHEMDSDDDVLQQNDILGVNHVVYKYVSYYLQ